MAVNGYRREKDYEDETSTRLPTKSWVKHHPGDRWTRVFINEDPMGGYMVTAENGPDGMASEYETGLGSNLSKEEAVKRAKNWMKEHEHGL